MPSPSLIIEGRYTKYLKIYMFSHIYERAVVNFQLSKLLTAEHVFTIA